MGTNYYLKVEPEDRFGECGSTQDEMKHIGKSSGGWHFALHVIPEQGINTLEDWIALFDLPKYRIYDEYGEKLTKAEMLSIIMNRGRSPIKFPYEDRFEGRLYKSLQEYCSVYNLELGYNNLFRHPIGRWCAGHGPGPWDYILGEFS